MFYPFGDECETQPLIAMHNITLRDITSHGSLLPPGIIRCNHTNACTGFVWDNVQASGLRGWWDWAGLGFIT
jgi:hypothetical protein